jgi:hypothetical protein
MGAFDDLIPKTGGAFDDLIPAADPYKAAARKEYDELKAKGVPVEPSLTRRVAHGLTLGASDEILAGLSTPIEMVKRGTLNPAEGYRSAKAWQDLQMEEARKNQGIPGHLAEIAGGVGTGLGAARAGLTLARQGMGLPARAAALGTEGALYGGAYGGLDANGGERLSGATTGALVGGGLGAGLPVVGAAVGAALRGPINYVRGAKNPEAAALRHLARTVDDSGRPINDVVNDVTTAAAEGQPAFTVADALGLPGQRALSGVTRTPGPGRTMAAEFLENRQGGQARSISNALAEGFDAQRTPAQLAEEIVTTARQVNRPAYEAAYAAGDRPIMSPRLEQLTSSPTIQGAMNGAMRKWRDWAAIDGYGSMNPPLRVGGVTDGRNSGVLMRDGTQLPVEPNIQFWDYTARDLAGKAQAARNAGNSQEATRYGSLERLVKEELDNIVPEFRATRAGAKAYFDRRDAIKDGAQAFRSGRTEDTIPAFRNMSPQEQAAYRVGYADPAISAAQGGAPGANKARPLLNDAFQAEAAVMAPGNALMQRRIGRENIMSGTRQHALGGSLSADNLAEMASQVDPSILVSILSGNFAGAARQGLGGVANLMQGMPPAMRAELAKLLLQRGLNPTVAPQLAAQQASSAQNAALAAALARGGAGGVASTTSTQRNR